MIKVEEKLFKVKVKNCNIRDCKLKVLNTKSKSVLILNFYEQNQYLNELKLELCSELFKKFSELTTNGRTKLE